MYGAVLRIVGNPSVGADTYSEVGCCFSIQRHEPPGVHFGGPGATRVQHPSSHPTDSGDSRETLIDVPKCRTAGYFGGLVDSEKVPAAAQVLNSKADVAMALSA